MNPLAAMRALLAVSVYLAGTIRVPAGEYTPIRGMHGIVPRVHVAAFDMDTRAVTRGEYLAFVRAHAEWQRGSTDASRAEESYLAEWRGPLDPGDATDLLRPVTSVSWYAANAYCEAEGKRLPTTDEWEYAARASDTSPDGSHDAAYMSRLLAMYASRTVPLQPVTSGVRNAYGIQGLHGSAWEWTRDFKPAPMTSCAGSAIGAADPSDYPALLREAFRSALTERTTARTLGFRCAATASH